MIALVFSSIAESIGFNIHITVMHNCREGIIQNHCKQSGELEENPRMSLRERKMMHFKK